MSERWKSKKKPAALDARFDFEDFEVLRAFLDEVAEEAERLDHHPNISFGRDRVSIVIYSTSDVLSDIDHALAKAIDEGYDKVMKND
jgi:pterin-4a-carbinolamine dehydratase